MRRIQINNMKNLILFTVLFIFGIIFILNSDSWNLGSIESMHLAGALMAILGGAGIIKILKP